MLKIDVSSPRFEMMRLFISLHRIIYILYLFDGALLQMFLHCFLDEKLLLVKLHPRVFFHNIFHDGLVWNPKPVITRLQRKWTRNHTHKTLYNKEKTNNKHTCLTVLRDVCTHRNSFDEDIIHFVLSACKVSNRNLFAAGDASPRRNRPFHLLDFGFLVLVAILQPVTKKERDTSSVTWVVSLEAIFHCDCYHPYLCNILTLVGEHSSVLRTVQPRSPCICHFVRLSPTGKTKWSFRTSVLMITTVIRP